LEFDYLTGARDRWLEFMCSCDPDFEIRPATEAEMLDFEKEFGNIPAEYRYFLKKIGFCYVFSEHVDDIKSLIKSHRKFSEESKGLDGWSWEMRDVFIIGWDGAGNPFGICMKTQKIMIEYMGSGVEVFSDSFQELLENGLPS